MEGVFFLPEIFENDKKQGKCENGYCIICIVLYESLGNWKVNRYGKSKGKSAEYIKFECHSFQV